MDEDGGKEGGRKKQAGDEGGVVVESVARPSPSGDCSASQEGYHREESSYKGGTQCKEKELV